MNKKIIFLSFFTSYTTMNMENLKKRNLFELLPVEIQNHIASSLPFFDRENSAEAHKRVEKSKQGSMKNDIIVKYDNNKKTIFKLTTPTLFNSTITAVVPDDMDYELLNITENSKKVVWRKIVEIENAPFFEFFSFSPDYSKIILSGGYQKKDSHFITIYDRNEQKELMHLNIPIDNNEIVAIAVSSDGNYAAYLQKVIYVDTEAPLKKNGHLFETKNNYYVTMYDTHTQKMVNQYRINELTKALNPILSFNKQTTLLLVHAKDHATKKEIAIPLVKKEIDESKYKKTLQIYFRQNLYCQNLGACNLPKKAQ